MGMGTDAMVRLAGVTKRFGNVWALRGIDLELQRGRCLSIFGPNGAGKTTLLKILSTLTRPSAGTVTIAGHDAVREAEKVRPLLGVLGHRTFLYGHLTGQENLRFYARMFGMTGYAERAMEVLHAVGLEEHGQQLVRTYSRGMQQRLAIARTLLHRPPLLLLDEPYTGLDQQAIVRLQELLQQLHAAAHTIILSTHDLRLGLMLSDDIAIQCRGKMVYHGVATDLNALALEQLYFDYVK
jgi:heme exporter protein A